MSSDLKLVQNLLTHHITVVQGHIPLSLTIRMLLVVEITQSLGTHMGAGLPSLWQADGTLRGPADEGRPGVGVDPWVSVDSSDSSCRLPVTMLADWVVLSPFTWPAGQGQKTRLQRLFVAAQICFSLRAHPGGITAPFLCLWSFNLAVQVDCWDNKSEISHSTPTILGGV